MRICHVCVREKPDNDYLFDGQKFEGGFGMRSRTAGRRSNLDSPTLLRC